MRRAVSWVLLLTAGALAVAIARAPLREEVNFIVLEPPDSSVRLQVGGWHRNPYRYRPFRGWIWELGSRPATPNTGAPTVIDPPGAALVVRTVVYWPRLLPELLGIALLGGLLALALQTEPRWRSRWRQCAVVAVTVCGIGATIVVVPVRYYCWIDITQHDPDAEVAKLEARIQAGGGPVDEHERRLVEVVSESGRRRTAQPIEPAWPPRYRAIWKKRSPSPMRGAGQAWMNGEWIAWPVLLAEQALILLLGGGLLTWVVRRERRRIAR